MITAGKVKKKKFFSYTRLGKKKKVRENIPKATIFMFHNNSFIFMNLSLILVIKFHLQVNLNSRQMYSYSWS